MTDALKTDLTEGDVVRLNSGGPKMTVLQTKSDGSVKCQWFDRNGKTRTESFSLKTINIFVTHTPPDEDISEDV